ncbi:hypothetical protein [Streptomyces xanthophaeus]|nr:hypothetical protein [Streptomyces xanthophaeus]WCD87187.1 hypothetical protein KPP03845_103560 [Streptomyces xanthophaeus]WST23243.1 hypothetical protein OG264_18110 [Streptomyces xanthophaeus]WST61780.1 hypothetical protein OG605_20325 [Streptomyces xanthophaeus]
MANKKETLRWTPVGILLVFALVAPLFGDNPTGIIIPLLLAMVLASVNLMMKKSERAGNGG